MIKLTPYNWNPGNEDEKWLDLISKQNDVFVKYEVKSDKSEFSMKGLMISLNGHYIHVMPEETICAHCNKRNPLGAVPDFGFPYSKLEKEVIFSVPRCKCVHCGKILDRRIVVWQKDVKKADV